MNRKVLLLAGAIGALFAGKSATTSTPAPASGATVVDFEPVGGAVDIRCDDAVARTPSPAQSHSLPVGPHQVAIRARELGPVDFPRFVERPMRRKVKYGRNRWVLLG